MKQITIMRTGEKQFTVQSGPSEYHITGTPRWSCDCLARGMCKHLRTALSGLGLAVGDSIDVAPNTDSSDDDGLLDNEEFDFEAGRDVRSEIDHIRSGQEKRNCGC